RVLDTATLRSTSTCRNGVTSARSGKGWRKSNCSGCWFTRRRGPYGAGNVLVAASTCLTALQHTIHRATSVTVRQHKIVFLTGISPFFSSQWGAHDLNLAIAR